MGGCGRDNLRDLAKRLLDASWTREMRRVASGSDIPDFVSGSQTLASPDGRKLRVHAVAFLHRMQPSKPWLGGRNGDRDAREPERRGRGVRGRTGCRSWPRRLVVFGRKGKWHAIAPWAMKRL